MSAITDQERDAEVERSLDELERMIYSPEPSIYGIRNLIDFKIYVGSTKNMRQRVRRHRYDLKKGVHKNPHLQNAYNKYGKRNFVYFSLQKWDIFSLKDAEQHWIDFFKSYDREFGYNHQPAAYSNKGVKLSEKTRKKIGDFFRGKPKTIEQNKKNADAHLGSKNINYGKPISEKLSRAIAAANIRGRQKFKFLNPDGKWIEIVGLQYFCKQNGLSAAAMSQVYNGKQGNHQGWKSEKSLIRKQRKIYKKSGHRINKESNNPTP